MKTETIELTKTEIGYLYNLVKNHIEQGSYWGREEYFIKTQKSVLEKLDEIYGVA